MDVDGSHPQSDPRRVGVRPQDYAPWVTAWADALYGPAGFYRRPEGPAGHFRTASHAAPGPLARALARLARQTGCSRVVDVGAGRGELLVALAALEDAADGPVPLGLHGCDVVPRPATLPDRVGWSAGLQALLADLPLLDDALVVGWELLDVVPCPVVEVDGTGAVREVLVDPATGRERLGDPPGPDDAAWLARWWPLDGRPTGTRAEVGRPRDALWSALAARCAATPHGAVLLAVDYAHTAATRPPAGSLAGYRGGLLVDPVPDGSCDVTAHVALDAVAAAAGAAGASAGVVVRQRGALRSLGLSAGPGAHPGSHDPSGAPLPAATILRALAERSAVAELLDPDGLGGFSWLLSAAGRPQPVLPEPPGPPGPPDPRAPGPV
ncbi:SAM-dependent methyltransferase [Kineosporia sp. R_H_3]|uniref:SAM-dependent methyltransferase n=1 Tax=Kineosporia sp. R_H_3 TaxID=1961848 RepID=UPI0018E984DD|nr:SAM-dependent methyltransferase [Kineosporia sp. R_H_3]